MNPLHHLIDWHRNIKSCVVHSYQAHYLLETESIELEHEFDYALKKTCDPYLLSAIADEYKESESPTGDRKSVLYNKDLPPLEENFSRLAGYSIPLLSKKETAHISCTMEKNCNELKESLLSISGLVILLYFNQYDVYRWEIKDTLSSYKYRKGLKLYFNKAWNEKRIDISNRPGRFAYLEGGVRFQGAHEYYFGPASAYLFPRERLLGFKGAQLTEELDNGIIHVKLFDIDKYWLPENRKILADFRAHLRIDELAAKYAIEKKKH